MAKTGKAYSGMLAPDQIPKCALMRRNSLRNKSKSNCSKKMQLFRNYSSPQNMAPPSKISKYHKTSTMKGATTLILSKANARTSKRKSDRSAHLS